jgi:hypothetical protein
MWVDNLDAGFSQARRPPSIRRESNLLIQTAGQFFPGLLLRRLLIQKQDQDRLPDILDQLYRFVIEVGNQLGNFCNIILVHNNLLDLLT